jgi:acyl-CoA reductase-like NAD-dependent aldehyde dehydrogenase
MCERTTAMNVAEGMKSISIRKPDHLFIAGKWVTPAAPGSIEVVSPMTEEVIYTVAEAREADVDSAVAAAREAFDAGPWPRLSPLERAEYLRRFGAALAARGEELGHAWTNQMGVIFAMARGAAERARDSFDMYADMAVTYPFAEGRVPSLGGGQAIVLREAVGVVAAIVPWNSPLSLGTAKLAPALLAGCTLVYKASPEAPIEAYIFAEIAEEIGLPAGVLNVVTAHRAASEHLIRNPGVDKVSFTGSSAAGKHIAAILGQRMARYTMELGGKSAAIVLDDMEPGDVAASLSGALCTMSGQVCAALTRVIVPARRHDEFADAFADTMGALRPGNPYDPSSHLGPLAMARQLARVRDYIAKGQAQGARLAVGGGRPAGLNRGYYIEPTLFSGVDNAMSIAREEIFGPVISLIPAIDEHDAIRIANDSDFGLNGAVMTKDPARALDVAKRIRTGTVSQNRFRLDKTLPFGGYKQSGVGREGGVDGLLPYLETKTVFLDSAIG